MSSPIVWPRAFALLLGLCLIPGSILWLVCVVTWSGWILGLSMGLIGLGPLLWCIGDERESDRQTRFGKGCLLIGLIGVAVIAWRAPAGHTTAEGQMHTRYSDGQWHFDRFSFWNVVPEIDQIHLGFAAALALDPLFTRKQANELAELTDEIYAEQAQNSEFHACGSAMGQIYNEMTLLSFNDGHYFHYIPTQADRTQPSPALVFLHGSGGNFKAYTWLLAQLAEKTGHIVIAPTFGLGNWEKRGASEAINSAIQDATRHAEIDFSQIHLMGLSNGGKGVSLFASTSEIRFRSLIFLSALIHNSDAPRMIAAKNKDTPVLALSGGSDERIPWDYITHYTLKMADEGLPVTTRRIEGADHFLFFRQRHVVLDEIADWLEEHR